MIVSSIVFGKHIGRSRGWVCKLVRDMKAQGYHVSRDGKTTLFDDRDALECLDRRSKKTGKVLTMSHCNDLYHNLPPQARGQKGGS